MIIVAIYQSQLQSTHSHVCVCVCLCVHVCEWEQDNLKNYGSINLKLKHLVVYENSSYEFHIVHFSDQNLVNMFIRPLNTQLMNSFML